MQGLRKSKFFIYPTCPDTATMADGAYKTQGKIGRILEKGIFFNNLTFPEKLLTYCKIRSYKINCAAAKKLCPKLVLSLLYLPPVG